MFKVGLSGQLEQCTHHFFPPEPRDAQHGDCQHLQARPTCRGPERRGRLPVSDCLSFFETSIPFSSNFLFAQSWHAFPERWKLLLKSLSKSGYHRKEHEYWQGCRETGTSYIAGGNQSSAATVENYHAFSKTKNRITIRSSSLPPG